MENESKQNQTSGSAFFYLLLIFNILLTVGWACRAFGRVVQSHGFILVMATTSVVFTMFSLAGYTWLYRVRRFSSRAAFNRTSVCSCACWMFAVFMPEYLFGSSVLMLRTRFLAGIACALYLILITYSKPSETSFATNHTKRTCSPVVSLTVLVILYFLASSYLALRKLETFGYAGQDMAYFCQIFYTTLHGRLFNGNLYQDLYYTKTVYSDFAGHNSPIMVIFLPFYYLSHSASILLVVRNVFISLCAWPLYLIARRRYSREVSAIVCVQFLLLPTVLFQNLFDFYPLSLAAFFLAFCFFFYWERRFLPFSVFLVLSLFVREDLIFVVFGIGLLALWNRRGREWVLIPLLMSTIWGILSFGVIMPHFLAGSRFMQQACFSHLGSNPGAILGRILTHPLSSIFTRENLIYLKDLSTPFAGYLMCGSILLALAVPNLGINLLASGHCNTTVLYAQYSLIPILMFFLAFLFALRKHASMWTRFGLKQEHAERGVAIFSLALSLGSLVFYTDRQEIEDFQRHSWELETARVIQQIPDQVSLAAPGYIVSRA